MLYDQPVAITGMVVGIQSQRSWIEAGLADYGDLVLSLSPYEVFKVRDWDKVGINWNEGELYAGEVIPRGTSHVDRLRYVPKKVTKVFSVDSATGEVTEYFEGASFAVSGNTLTWVQDPQPPSGRNYTVEYDPIFEWIAFLPTVQRREQDQNIGQRVLLRKKHVATRTR